MLLPADLRDEEAARASVRDAVEQLGGLDVLVNNAGFQMARRESIADITTDDLDRTFTTNLYALFWVTQTALEHLSDGGAIINNSSIQAYQPSESLLDYAATKAAINNFTVNLAAEVGSRGIRVNAVAPGPIWTPLQPATQPPEKIEKFGSDTPAGPRRSARRGRPRVRLPRLGDDRVLRLGHGAGRDGGQAGLLMPQAPRIQRSVRALCTAFPPPSLLK